ncbi:glycosyl hydrolase family 76 [Diaporthe eres]|uniref:Mannan endo-1,6-alpha-mannosidase n=1 Tax=Diaporthe vaccinii TaxID=105482 RepID=A0ABR4E3Y6_9PEZI|nr:glycosyl hydrolase family 76 [Diaporthe eres]
MRSTAWPLCALSVLAPLAAASVDIDWSSDDSIKQGAGTIAWGMLQWYTGNNTGDVPGNLPDPYYWWEAGAMFGTLVDYWAYTDDDSYVDETYQAIQHQIGDDGDFMPENQTLTEGNDDQGFWAMAAMTAAETNFKNPNSTNDGGVEWLASVQAVFNEYVWRWEQSNDTCAGGLRWQIFTFNTGYTYKNTISNGCFFNIASRLALYTGNESYADWATTVYDWMDNVGFIDDDFNVYDGADSKDGKCSNPDRAQWTYNAGIFMHGAAAMYNHTGGDEVWGKRVTGLIKRTSEYFFKNNIISEPPCEPQDSCRTDNYSFKGYALKWMAKTAQLMPSVRDTLKPMILASGKAAAASCTGSAAGSAGATLDGIACGFKWTGSTNDGTSGIGQQMSALQAVLFTLDGPAPLSADTGGTSTGDSSGGSDKTDKSIDPTPPITTGDRAGAGILTAMALAGMLGGCGWMIMD